MDNYNSYIIDLVLKSRIASANGTTSSAPVEEVSANLQSSSDGSGWTIDKTYADLQALQAKGILTSLAWHREDGSIVTVPLTSTGPVDGKDAFVFSTILTTADGSTFNAFILDEDDVLTYVTEDIGGGGGGGGVDTAFKVVGLKDGHPDVSSPSKKIIYLTKEAGSTARDPYTEWIYTDDSQWQIIGETSVDLTDYAKKEDLDDYAKTSDLDSYATKAELSNYALQSAVDGKIDKVDPHGVSGVIPSFTPTGDLMSSGLNVSDVATKDYCSGAYKPKQTTVPDPTASGNAVSFIDSISQDANGVISATKKTPPLVTQNNTAGFMSSEDKTKLDGIESHAEANVQSNWGETNPTSAAYIVNKPGLATTSVAGLMSQYDKEKLDGIALGAEVNTIESISINGVPQTPDANRNVDLTITSTGGVQGVKLDGAQSPLTPDASDIVTIPNATSAGSQNATNGLMTASDKQKLDGISSNNLVPTTTGVIDQVLTTNSSGTVVWSSDVFVTKMFPEHEVDIGNVIYKTVIMPDGSEWMTENLDYKFTGCDISYPISPILGNPTTPTAWYYNNNESYSRTGFKCGLLYNWYAVKLLEQNKQDLLPPGWHVPTLAEMQSMVNSVGANAGTKLKATSVQWTEYWDGTDQYEFNFTPTGYYSSGEFKYMGRTDDVGPTGYNWSITDSQDSSILKASALYMTYGSPNVMYYTNTANKEWAMGLRLVKHA